MVFSSEAGLHPNKWTGQIWPIQPACHIKVIFAVAPLFFSPRTFGTIAGIGQLRLSYLGQGVSHVLFVCTDET